MTEPVGKMHCSSMDDMIRTMQQMEKQGYATDFDYDDEPFTFIFFKEGEDED